MLIVWNEPEFERVFHSETGPVGLHVAKLARQVTRTAQRYAPVSADGSAGRPPGYLRAKIRWDMGRDLIGVYADISSPARTANGAPYGLFMEVGTRPHPIRARRPDGWLRWWGPDGRVHFTEVARHPGTEPRAYLRRALASLRGA
ncbi:hypothetical protein [Nonomuraea helvata]|uniref:Uncharacterized protein n=1 Tax=Nonomuraea helvata TaxID=37484 RepID=A0ABV5SI55_9ACTN